MNVINKHTIHNLKINTKPTQNKNKKEWNKYSSNYRKHDKEFTTSSAANTAHCALKYSSSSKGF